MNDYLRAYLKTVFNLTDAEFSESLSMEDISSWDSLTHMDLITGLENEFKITLTMQDIIEMRSFPSIVKTLSDKGISLEG